MPPLPHPSEFPEAFQAFGLPVAGESLYAFSPVFRVRWEGQDAVLKRTQSPVNAARLGRWTSALRASGTGVVAPLAPAAVAHEHTWVLYPFVPGRPYAVTPEAAMLGDLRAAGKLLGVIHQAGTSDLLPFRWPDNHEQAVQEDVAGLDDLLVQGRITADTAAKLTAWETAFNDDVYAPLWAAGLPCVDGSMDFKANNLVFRPAGPTLIDPDNGEFVPRVFDLALAALLFHLDLPAPGRPFTPGEWRAFRDAYLHACPLTLVERDLWPLALRYVYQEWGVWHLVTDQEGWDTPGQRDFLHALANVNLHDFSL